MWSRLSLVNVVRGIDVLDAGVREYIDVLLPGKF